MTIFHQKRGSIWQRFNLISQNDHHFLLICISNDRCYNYISTLQLDISGSEHSSRLSWRWFAMFSITGFSESDLGFPSQPHRRFLLSIKLIRSTFPPRAKKTIIPDTHRKQMFLFLLPRFTPKVTWQSHKSHVHTSSLISRRAVRRGMTSTN